VFNVQIHASQEYRSLSGRGQVLTRTNQLAVTQADCSFPVLVREFLHQFMTILSIKISQWPGPLHAVFASGLFSHGT